MARALLFISLLFPLLSIPCGGYDFIPPGPKEVFRSEGGSLRRWGPSETLEQWVGVAVVELTLEPGGFLLPRYLNTVSVGYVLEGGEDFTHRLSEECMVLLCEACYRFFLYWQQLRV